MLAERLVTYSEKKAEEKAIEIAKKLLLKGLSVDDISDSTGLSKNIVLMLKQKENLTLADL